MSELAILTLITAAVLIGGVGWLVRSALRPATEERDPDDMVHLIDAEAELEAKVVASKVQAFGIPAFVRNRQGPILYGFPPSFIGWEVLVRQGDVGRASELLGVDVDEESEVDDVADEAPGLDDSPTSSD